MNAQVIASGGSAPATTEKQQPPSKVIPAVRPSAPGRRRKRSGGLLGAFAMVVLAPTLLAAIYFGLIASPLYVSEAHVTIRSTKQQSTSVIEAVVTQGAGVNLATETELVADYLRSRDLLNRIENQVGFRERYATYQADFFSRLEPGASREEAHKYFQQVVQVSDAGSGLLEIKVKAFTAADAHTVIQAAISAAEVVVNQLSDQAQADALTAAEAEVTRALDRVTDALGAIAAFQQAKGDIDPRRSAEAILAVVAGLEASLAEAQIERAELRSVLRPTAPAVKALNSRIGALQRELAQARARLADNRDSDIAEDVQAFDIEQKKLQLAERAYESALISQQTARQQAQNDRSYLVAYVPPSMPDVATEPKRLYKITTAFVVSLLAFGVGALIIGAIREHARA